MVGLFEPVCAPWNVGGDPGRLLVRRAPARLGPHGARTSRRRWRASRSSLEVGVRKFFCGPESFTPDLQPIVGEAPELKNYFVAAGLNSIGILTGGGLGRVLAHWIVDGRPDVDVTGINIDRLHTLPGQPRVPRAPAPSSRSAWSTSATTRRGRCRPRAARSSRRSTTGWPRAARTSGRQRLGGRRLVRARRASSRTSSALSWGRQNWFPYWAAEHRAAREGVILMDMSFMSKFLVQGRDAGRLLDQHLGQPRRRRRRA